MQELSATDTFELTGSSTAVFSFTLEAISNKHFDQWKDIFHLEKKEKKESK